MYALTRQQLQRDLRKAATSGMPEWAVAYCEGVMRRADFYAQQSRNKEAPRDVRAKLFDRAVRELLSCSDFIGGFRRAVVFGPSPKPFWS
jgi:hypothetical protein